MAAILNRLIALALLLQASLALGQTPYAPAADTERVVYRHANVIDGTGGPVQRDMAVITRGAGIDAVVADSALAPAQLRGARIVDLTGRWLLPGLIDSHQHIATPPNRRQAEAILRRQAWSGVTTIRVMADDLRSVAELARARPGGRDRRPHNPFRRLDGPAAASSTIPAPGRLARARRSKMATPPGRRRSTRRPTLPAPSPRLGDGEPGRSSSMRTCRPISSAG